MDLIDRRAAIDAIESHIRTAEEPYQLTQTDKVLNYALEISASCVYNLPSAQPEQQWIPCSVCDLCIYNPPSSMDGKPCSMCVAQDKPKDPDSWSYS